MNKSKFNWNAQNNSNDEWPNIFFFIIFPFHREFFSANWIFQLNTVCNQSTAFEEFHYYLVDFRQFDEKKTNKFRFTWSNCVLIFRVQRNTNTIVLCLCVVCIISVYRNVGLSIWNYVSHSVCVLSIQHFRFRFNSCSRSLCQI